MTEASGPVADSDPNIVIGPEIDGAPDEPVLAVDQIQGNVMPGFATKHQAFLGVRFGEADRDRVRAWLDSLLGSIATLAQVNDFRTASRARVRRGEPAPSGPTWTNIAFDHKGLSVLAPSVDGIEEKAFIHGMTVESNLGDPKDSAHEGHPSRWVVGGTPDNTPEAFLVLGNDDESTLRRDVARLGESVAAAGLSLRYEQFGHVLPGEIEHFGFRDGISQVAARGRLSERERHYFTRRAIDPSDDRALCFARPGRPLIWPGQFLFGYAKQNESDPVQPGGLAAGGQPWMDDGSFLVFRRLRQDVPTFRRFLSDEAARLAGEGGLVGMTPERLAALIVGRWPNGVALMRSETGAEPDPGDRFLENHFGFAGETRPVGVTDDPSLQDDDVAAAAGKPFRTVPGVNGDRFGRVCPGLAHIRKVNPRDLQTDQGGPDRTLTFQVLRRGITWGDAYPSDTERQEHDDGQRGLLFLCYQTCISEQFGTLNTKWMNRFDGPEGGTGHDLLVGQGGGDRRERRGNLPGVDGNPLPLVTMSEWVIPTGGGYFFAPSIRALRVFAGR